MIIIEELLKISAPIYIVQNSFITTIPYARKLPKIYTDVFLYKMTYPLQIINEFINDNLIKSNYPNIFRINGEGLHTIIDIESLKSHRNIVYNINIVSPLSLINLTILFKSILPINNIFDSKILDLFK